MKKTFKLITLLALTISLALYLFGCHPKNEKIELRIGFWPESSETKDIAMYNVWKEKFETDYPQYEIIADPYTYATDTISAKYLSGELPTVFQTWFTEPEKLMKAGIIRDITDELTGLGWVEKMDDEMLDTLSFDGKIYGVPRDGYGLGLLINVKAFGENGLLEEDPEKPGRYLLYNSDGTPAYPTTFDEIYEASQIICEYEADRKGILICSDNKNGGWQLCNFAWNFGAELEYQDESGNWKANLDTEGMVNALEWIRTMKSEDLLLKSINVLYDEWYSSIESKVAMAIVGSDVLSLAVTSGGMNMDDLAFVPMPTGDGEHRYSLYGGTPYVFNKDATDEEVLGVLRFFDYIGRSPSTSKTNIDAMKEGYDTALLKGQPVIPKIKAWDDPEYLNVVNALEEEYITVDMYYYNDFFDSIKSCKKTEVPMYAQDMYEFLDTAIQNVFAKPDQINVKAQLTTASSNLQKLLDKDNKK